MGYAGCGRLIAFEVSTTEGTRCVVGGFTTGGSGALSGTTTVAGVLEHVTQFPESLVEAVGGLTLRPVRRTGPVDTGISVPLTPTSLGTTRGSFVGGTTAVLSAIVMFRSTGAFDAGCLRTGCGWLGI